jgi:hypothetical protein
MPVKVYDGTNWVTVAGDGAQGPAGANGTNGTGLTLITSSPFSTVSSHSINNCFTSSYVNYRILINFSAASGDNVTVSMKLRASGTDTSTNYVLERLYANSTTVGADVDPAGTDEWYVTSTDKDFPTVTSAQLNIGNPQTAAVTTVVCHSFARETNPAYLAVGGYQNSTTQFDGLTLIASTGTMSGTIRVYGYQNS